MNRCPNCQRPSERWLFWGALVLALTTGVTAFRLDRERVGVHENRIEGDSLLMDWKAKKCIPVTVR